MRTHAHTYTDTSADTSTTDIMKHADKQTKHTDKQTTHKHITTDG